QDRHCPGAGARPAQRDPRRTHQRPRRDDHPRPARLPRRAARGRPLRDLLQPHHAGGRRALRPHRGGGAGPRRRPGHPGRTARRHRRGQPRGCIRETDRQRGRTARMKPDTRNRTGFMATLFTVVRKEWRDFARDRRTLFLSLLVAPLLYPLIFLGIGKLTEMRSDTQLEKTLSVPVVGMERAPNLVKFLATYGIEAREAPADIEARVRAQQEDLALDIDARFAEDWHAGKPAKVDIITDTTRRNADVAVARVSKVLESYGNGVGAMRLLIRGINPAVAAPLHVGTRDMAT